MFQEVSPENNETQHIQMITKSNYAREMYGGDAKAKEKLQLGYLPQVAVHLKHWTAKYILLELSYRCCQTLDQAIDTFNFTHSNKKFPTD